MDNNKAALEYMIASKSSQRSNRKRFNETAEMEMDVNAKAKMPYVKKAIASAKSVLSIYEKEYPSDKRPARAIKAVEAWMKNPTERNKEKAGDAYSDAYSATKAATQAAISSKSAEAASRAAKSISYAAYAVAGAALSAAEVAFRAARFASNAKSASNAASRPTLH